MNKSQALKLKFATIASILIARAIGVCLPMLGKAVPALSLEKNIFFIIKAFATGVILATGFIHVLPDAFENLTLPCLNENPWGKFPFTGFIAMMAAIGTLMVVTSATSYYQKSNMRKSQTNNGDEENDVDHVSPIWMRHVSSSQWSIWLVYGHIHSFMNLPTLASGTFPAASLIIKDVQRDSPGNISVEHDHDGAVVGMSNVLFDIVCQIMVLELGIVVHSVIIGISLGASESPKTISPFVSILTFHQFFEGMGLGGCISQAKFKGAATTITVLFFSLTTPIGIGIGIRIRISNVYDENNPTTLIVEGIFNAASAGILIYMSLVDL
ncbi:hypothetical protein EZV62_015562 [Acer yangbiense]|uniref:Zinc/iron permease n=1 Tax=Acer yangbiense TaxID=1000413 RepID=A0A5C7HL68_9ROSI|nr:hypothetical protein EZV62_015562 [Acer yangbiense]